MDHYLLSQIFAAIAVFFIFIVGYLTNDRQKILISGIIGMLFWIPHYYLLNAYTGSAMTAIISIFMIICYYRPYSKHLDHNLIPALFLAIIAMITYKTWDGPASLLVAIGTIFSLLSRWQLNPKNNRLIILGACTIWTIYEVFYWSPVAFAADFLAALSVLIAIYRFDLKKEKIKIKT